MTPNHSHPQELINVIFPALPGPLLLELQTRNKRATKILLYICQTLMRLGKYQTSILIGFFIPQKCIFTKKIRHVFYI